MGEIKIIKTPNKHIKDREILGINEMPKHKESSFPFGQFKKSVKNDII